MVIKKGKKKDSKAGLPPNADRTFEEYASAFGTARMSKLSGYGGKYGTNTGTARDAEKLWLGMIGFAEKYGTPEQVKALMKMNPAKLRKMYQMKLLRTQEYFDYDPEGYVNDPIPGIQRAINTYNMLNKEANRQQRERRSQKKIATNQARLTEYE